VKRTDLIYAPFDPDYCMDAKRAIKAIYKGVCREVAKLQAGETLAVARNSRATRVLVKDAELANKLGRIVVGATGIEPVTPTMSR
jgi:hypothetical protein